MGRGQAASIAVRGSLRSERELLVEPLALHENGRMISCEREQAGAVSRELAHRAERWSELEKRVATRRLELLEMRRQALAEAAHERHERRRELSRSPGWHAA